MKTDGYGTCERGGKCQLGRGSEAIDRSNPKSD